ncbi:hypothetical protein ACRALDRAFT_210288 [Sodiomyces alcalophilus JCM 7366]|uniref:uncharacterized protein n=1 Tax=Sodiomyces alcalophilus JCM 7366 TaxID=591952 RepID=UPI0039B5389C
MPFEAPANFKVDTVQGPYKLARGPCKLGLTWGGALYILLCNGNTVRGLCGT